MEELIQQFFEEAKKNKHYFKALKYAVVQCQQYELAAELREIEKAAFPQTEEQKAAHTEAEKIQGALCLVEASASIGTCWAVNEALKVYAVKGGSFSTDDAAEILAKRNQLFDRGDIITKTID